MTSYFANVHPAPVVANLLVDTFLHGGVLMWPLLGLSLVTLAVIVERLFWWTAARHGRDSARLDQVYRAIVHGRGAEAARLSVDSADPRLRVIAYGLEHSETDLEVAMQVRAEEEAKMARRFLDVLDTAITLAPLLGLLGTVTGIMRSFHFVGGDQELAAAKVSGGIGEALIATAFGLGIAITTLIPFNAFGSRVEALRHELGAVIGNVRLLNEKARRRSRGEILVEVAADRVASR
jgi:biopolymer transport protein ExbB